jgi:endonuclease G, mitochondrial
MKRRSPRSRPAPIPRGWLGLLVLVVLALSYLFRDQEPGPAPAPNPTVEANDPLALGNPSNAISDPMNSDNYLVIRPQFVLSYSRIRGGPNWVSWHLDRGDMGSVERENVFMPDPLLPEEWRIRPGDYQGSGFDRGHMCPSGDRTRRRADNEATFVMSNMLPQTGELNREVWRLLEEYCRDLAREGSELYITCGGYGSRGEIGDSKVTVPARCWKIVVVLPEGEGDLARIDGNTRVIAVDMPNTEGIENDRWQQYLTSAASIERKTGYRFLANLSDSVREVLLSKRDLEALSRESAPRGRPRRGN